MPDDLLRAPDPLTVRMEPFKVHVGQVKMLQDSMSREQAVAKKKMQQSVRKSNFEKYFRVALERRGLFWDQPLHGDESRMMHFEYRNIMGKPPKYLTADRFMVHVEEMPRPYCRKFLDSLSSERTIVLNDWGMKLNTSVGMAKHDRGVILPGQEIHYKGESDASFKEGKATVGAILWLDTKIRCEIYCNVPCKSSTMAEARGVFIQLEMGIPLQFLQPCTDNYPIYRVLKGSSSA